MKEPLLSNKKSTFLISGISLAITNIKVKKLLFLILFVATAPIVIHAYPTDGSGACSSHKGVNCSIGSHIDGSAICNDGWVDSSIKYHAVQECKLSLDDICPYPTYRSSNTEYSCKSDLNKCEGSNQAAIVNNITSGRSMYSPTEADNIEAELPDCGAQYDSCVSPIQKEMRLINQWEQCSVKATKEAEKRYQLALESMKRADKFNQLEIKKSSCGSFSSYNESEDKCYCDIGYEISDTTNQCALKKIEELSQPVTITPVSTKEPIKVVQNPVLASPYEENLNNKDLSTVIKEVEYLNETQEPASSSSSVSEDVGTLERNVQNKSVFARIINFLSKFKFW